jgi:transposase-like protein
MSKAIQDLAEKVWNWRKENGYLKSLPKEIRRDCCEVVSSGAKQSEVAKAIGVSPKSVFNWYDKYKSEKEITNQFVEIKDVEKTEQSLINKYEVHLFMSAHGCKIEIRGSDFSVVNRLMKKLEK